MRLSSVTIKSWHVLVVRYDCNNFFPREKNFLVHVIHLPVESVRLCRTRVTLVDASTHTLGRLGPDGAFATLLTPTVVVECSPYAFSTRICLVPGKLHHLSAGTWRTDIGLNICPNKSDMK